MDVLEFHRDVTFFIGENGSGKSTVLEAIAAVMNYGAQGGTGNFRMADSAGSAGLQDYVTPKRSLKAPRDK
jgi:predicted ATPase